MKYIFTSKPSHKIALQYVSLVKFILSQVVPHLKNVVVRFFTFLESLNDVG